MITSTQRRTVSRGTRTVGRLDEEPGWDGDAVEALRAREYARLDRQGQTYLDYTGGGLYAESQIREHQALLRTRVLGQPAFEQPGLARLDAVRRRRPVAPCSRS